MQTEGSRLYLGSNGFKDSLQQCKKCDTYSYVDWPVGTHNDDYELSLNSNGTSQILLFLDDVCFCRMNAVN